MCIGNLSLSSFVPTVMAATIERSLAGIWSGIKNRAIAIIQVGSTLPALGFISGLGSVWVIDALRDKHIKSTQPAVTIKDPLSQRLQTISDARKAVLGCAVLGILAGVCGLIGRFSLPINVALSCFAAGFTLGEQIWRDRVDSISCSIRSMGSVNCLTHTLRLSDHIQQLRGMTIAQLRVVGEAILEHPDKALLIDFSSCGLADQDVHRFLQADWLNKFYGFDLGRNPLLTDQSLKWIAEGVPADSTNILEYLNLTGNQVTNETLKFMADSGKFNQLTTLVISENSQITGEGLALIGEKGFSNLALLGINENPQLLTDQELDKWIGKSGFNTLEGLSIQSTQMTTATLDKLIDKTEWFRNLQGLDVSGNPELKFSSKITQLTKLAFYTENTRYHISYYFYGRGLFFVKCFAAFPCIPEIQKLMSEKKAHPTSPAAVMWNRRNPRSRYLDKDR